MEKFHVGVVIPTFDAGILLERCIQSLRKSESNANIVLSLAVIDNHSQALDKQFCNSSDLYFNLSNNPGFGSAANVGISNFLRDPKIDWIFLLNPDATIDPNFFVNFELILTSRSVPISYPVSPIIYFANTLIRINVNDLFQDTGNYLEIMDYEEIFQVFDSTGRPLESKNSHRKILKKTDFLTIHNDSPLPKFLVYFLVRGTNEGLTPKIHTLNATDFTPDRLIQNAGSEIYSPFSAGDLNFGYLASPAINNLGGPRRAWCGAATLFPKSYFESVGLFDESFFLYFEDTELSYRGLTKGILPMLEPSLTVFHEHSAITNKYSGVRAKAIWQSRQIFAGRTSGKLYPLMFTGLLATKGLFLVALRRTTFSHFRKYLFPEIGHSFIGFLKIILPSTLLRNSK